MQPGRLGRFRPAVGRGFWAENGRTEILPRDGDEPKRVGNASGVLVFFGNAVTSRDLEISHLHVKDPTLPLLHHHLRSSSPDFVVICFCHRRFRGFQCGGLSCYSYLPSTPCFCPGSPVYLATFFRRNNRHTSSPYKPVVTIAPTVRSPSQHSDLLLDSQPLLRR